jgi:hypothetical protein
VPVANFEYFLGCFLLWYLCLQGQRGSNLYAPDLPAGERPDPSVKLAGLDSQ